MSSPIGEPPVRRHLTAEAAVLVAQAARGARDRALRRLALLGAGPTGVETLDAHPRLPSRAGATVPWNRPEGAAEASVSPAPGEAATVPWNRPEGAAEALVSPAPGEAATVPWNRPEAPARVPPNPGEPATVPWNRPEAAALAAVAAPAGARAPARVPPNPGEPATVPWNRPEAAALAAVAAPVPGLLNSAANTAATVPWNRAEAPATEPLTRLLAAAAQRSAKASALQGEHLSRPSPHQAAPPANGPGLTPGPGLRPDPTSAPFPPHPSAPFGPAPTPTGPHPLSPGLHSQPDRPAPPPASPESPLLAEERLREELARILRADGLRHGLDLKER